MGTLTSCIKKAGKALPAAHAQTIREYAKDYQSDGLTPQKAAEAAISDLISELMGERTELVAEIRAAGGTAADRAPTAAPASQPVAPASTPVGDSIPAAAAPTPPEASLQDTPMSRVEPTLAEVPELPNESRTEPTLSSQPKEVERFTGMYRKGMREQNAKDAQKRLAKENPDLDWQVEADAQFGPDKYSVVGYEKKAVKPTEEAKPAKAAEPAKPAEDVPVAARRDDVDDLGARLRDPDVRTELERMAQNAGWAEKGGNLIRDPKTEQVTGRTKWVPKETWWAERGVNLNEEQTRAAVRKALAGESLGSRERALIEFMLKIAEDVVAQYNRATETLQETGDAQALQTDDAFDLAVDFDEAGLDFTSDNIVDSELVAAAMQANPAAVEAIPDSLEPAAFMARIREIIDGTQPQPAAQEGGETGAQAPVLEAYSQADLEARDKAVEDAQAQRRADDAEAERKAQADRERDSFSLTGSDRAADANPGQGDMLSAAETKPAVKPDEALTAEQRVAVEKYDLPATTAFQFGKGLAKNKMAAGADGEQSNYHDTPDQAAAELREFLDAAARRKQREERLTDATKVVVDKLRAGENPTFQEWKAAFPQLRDGHTYLRQPDISPILVEHFGFKPNNIRERLGKSAGTVTSDTGAKYPIVYFNRLADVLKTEAPSVDLLQQAGPLEDFGEKLEGARKFQEFSLSKEFSDEALAIEPFSKVWPASEIDQIEDKFAAAVAHTARAAVPAKPRVEYKLKRWVESVKTVRSLAQMIVRGDVTQQKLMDDLGQRYALKDFRSKVKLLYAIDRKDWWRIGQVQEAPEAYTFDKEGKRVATPMVSVVIDDRHRWLEGGGDVEDHLAAISMLLGTPVQEKRMQFELRHDRKGNYFINKKGDPEYRKLKTFDSVEAARAYQREHYDDLVAAWEDVKNRDNVREQDVRGKENRPRAGADYRQGKDVTPEQFDEAFSFKGVQFGNWVAQGNKKQARQGMLNQAYDALMDLANIVGIPPKAISLNGTLGLAFGARGSGWASAHYEPDTLVINLTKTRGAGALGHEWFHAVDNYFSHQRGGPVPFERGMSQEAYRQANYITYRPEPRYVRKDGRGGAMTKAQLQRAREKSPKNAYYAEENWQPDPKHPQGVRPEVERRFAELVEALNDSPMAERASSIDKGKSGYWSQIIERASRSFENYVISKMMERGFHNDYLANVVPPEMFQRAKERYPYLLPEEVRPIAEAFDNLFATVQTKETEQGVAMFSRTDDVAFAQEVLAELADADELFRYPVSQVSTLEGVFKLVLPDHTYVGEATREDEKAESGADVRHHFRTQDGTDYFIYERGNDVWMDVSRLQEGERGAGVYAAAMNYTHNAKKRFIGDPAGLSEAAVVRRTWAMLRSALRFGTTRHMEAAKEQLSGVPDRGIAPLAWSGDDIAKTRALIDSAISTLEAQNPDVTKFRFDFAKRAFLDQAGSPVDSRRFVAGAERGTARAARSGQTTLRAGILLKSLVSSQGGERPGILEHVLRGAGSLARGPLKATFTRDTQQAGPFDPMPMKDAKAFVSAMTYKWRNAARVNLHQSERDAPKELRAQIKAHGATGTVVAAYLSGEIYVFLDHIGSLDQLAKAILHESTHYGLRGMFGPRLDPLLMQIYDKNARIQAAADAIREEYPKLSRVEAVEEVLADMDHVPVGIMTHVVALARNLIRKWKPDLEISDTEVRALVSRALKFSKRGRPSVDLYGGGAAFSRSTRRPWMDSMPAPTQEALRKAGAWRKDDPTLAQRFNTWRADWRKRFQQGLFDQFAPIKELSYKAYMQMRLTRGVDATLEAMLSYGTIEMDNDGAIDVNYEKGGFFGVLSKLEDEHDRFIAWVVGNRAERLKREGRENNFTDEDIRRLKGLIQGNLPSGKPRLQAYSEALRQLNRYNRSVMDIAEKAGLIDPASRQFWEKDFYVPFYRVMDEAGNSNAPRNFGGAVNQYAFKVLKGGAQELGDPLHNMLLNWSHLIDASLKNQAARESLKEAEKQGIAIEADESTARQIAKSMGKKDAVVSVVDQGVRRWFLVDDPFVLDALRAVGFTGFQFQPLKLMAKFKRLLTFGVTIDPTFRIRNLIRDSLSMIGTNQANYNVLSNLVTGWKATREGEEAMGHLLAGGGLIRFGSLTEGDRAEHAKKLVQAGIEDKTVLDSQSKVGAVLQSAYDWWMHVGDRAENVNRAALYQKLRDEGKSHLEASYLTRDVMDFSLMGTWGAIRFLAQVVPFFNARMQGMYKLGRGAAEDPRRFAAVTGATALASVALLLAYKDDEDWKKREDWDRETYWWFKIGDTAYRIPKPFEIGVLASIVERGTEAMLTDELTGKQFAQRLGSMVWNQLSMNPIPQMFQPAIELWANKDFFTGRPIESAGMQRLSPKERVGANTSVVAQGLGQNNVVSPVQIDHLIHGYLGWLGLAVTSTVDTFAREAPLGLPERPSRRIDDIPVLGSFAKELPAYQSRYVTQLYDQAREAQQLMADIKHARDTGDLERAKELASDRDKVTDAKVLMRAERTLGQLNAQIRMVQAQRIPAEQKRARLDRLYETRNRLAQLTIEETRRSR